MAPHLVHLPPSRLQTSSFTEVGMTRRAFVKPNPLLDLLVNTDACRLAMARLELLGSTVKLAVLGEVSSRCELLLVHNFRLRVNG